MRVIKPMKKQIKDSVLYDIRGMELKKGNTVLVRDHAPKTATILWGTLMAVRINKEGVLEGKLKQYKGWYKNPIKLADK